MFTHNPNRQREIPWMPESMECDGEGGGNEEPPALIIGVGKLDEIGLSERHPLCFTIQKKSTRQ